MSDQSSIRHALRKALPPSIVSKLKEMTGAPDMVVSLRKLREKGFGPQAAIDIGAYAGEWTRQFRRIFPESAVLMFEPQPERTEGLRALCAGAKVELRTGVLGAPGQRSTRFYLQQSGSGVHASKRHSNTDFIELPVSALDAEVRGTGFERPSLIKLDVQASEAEVIAGGENTFRAVEVLIIELSLVNSYEKGLLAHEMIALLAGFDLFLYDIAGLLRANITKSTNEVDAVFVRRSSSLWDMRHFKP